MKNFLKKLFYWDHPAKGAFAGTTLLLVSLWLAPALYLLCDGWWYWTPAQLFRGNWPLIFLLLPLLILLYWLILFVRFHRSEILRGKPQWNSPGMLFSLAVLIPTLALAPMVSSKFGYGYGFCLLLIIPVWIIPPASMPGQWKFWLVRGLCWTGAFWCTDHFLKCLRLTWNYEWFFSMGSSAIMVRYGNYSPGKDLLIVYLGVILFIAGYLLSAKMYAAAAEIPFAKMFGLPVKIMLGIWAMVYLVSGGMAVAQHRAAERTAADLGEFFGYPLNASGVNTLLRKTGWSDWIRGSDRKQESAWDHYSNHPYLWSRNAEVELPEAVRKQWRAEIERFQPLKKLENELEKPLQPGFIPAEDGSVGTASNYLFIFDKFCGFERWKILFLLEENNPAEALKVLRRMEKAIEYYRRDPVNMHTLNWFDAQCRLNAMELLLADGRVPDPELKRWSADLEQREKEIPERERLSIYLHAVKINDRFYRFAHGFYSLPLYPLRWLYPPAWYYAARDRRLSLSRFRHNRYSELPIDKNDPKTGFIRKYYNPPVFIMIRLSRTLTAKYRAMRALIEIELEKRRTGKYPDKLRNPPVDPFTGKPMFYKKGKMPLIVKVWDPALDRLVPERREADGIAVWSLGENRKNEQGQDQQTVRQYADDVRAKIIFKKKSEP